MKIGFAQINLTVGDLRGNCELIIGAYQRLAAAGAELVLTPELAMTGYPPQDLVLKSRFVPENLELLGKLHAHVGDAALLVGFVDRKLMVPYIGTYVYLVVGALGDGAGGNRRPVDAFCAGAAIVVHAVGVQERIEVKPNGAEMLLLLGATLVVERGL